MRVRASKKTLIILAPIILATVALLLLVTITDGGKLPTIRGVSLGKVESSSGGEWRVAFKTSGATLTRTFDASEKTLAALRVTANCGSGNLYLRVSSVIAIPQPPA